MEREEERRGGDGERGGKERRGWRVRRKGKGSGGEEEGNKNRNTSRKQKRIFFKASKSIPLYMYTYIHTNMHVVQYLVNMQLIWHVKNAFSINIIIIVQQLKYNLSRNSVDFNL